MSGLYNNTKGIHTNRDMMEIIDEIRKKHESKEIWDQILTFFNGACGKNNNNGGSCRLTAVYELMFNSDNMDMYDKTQQQWLTKAKEIFNNDCKEKMQLYYSIGVTIYCLAVHCLVTPNYEMVFWVELIELLVKCGIFNIDFMRQYLDQQNPISVECLQHKFKQILQITDTHSPLVVLEQNLTKRNCDIPKMKMTMIVAVHVVVALTMLNYGPIQQNLI